MHIIIGFITAVAGLIWALNRLQNSGLDLNSFNPFYWYKRNEWQKKVNENPLYNLSSSIEVATVLILGMAKLTGEMTRELKENIIRIYRDAFNLSEKEATYSYTNSSFLLRDENNLSRSAKKIIEGNKEPFTKEQIQYLIDILEQVAIMESDPNDFQVDYLDTITKELKPPVKKQW